MENKEGARLASVLDNVAKYLCKGIPCLPSEANDAFDACSAVMTKSQGALNGVFNSAHERIDRVAQRDWGAHGPRIAGELVSLARGAEVATGDALVKIAGAANVLLRELMPESAPRPHGGNRSRSTATELFKTVSAQIRECDLQGVPQTSGMYKDLTQQAFRLAPLARAERAGRTPEALTLTELRKMRTAVEKALTIWHEQKMPQNCKEYLGMSATFFRVSAMVKNLEKGK